VIKLNTILIAITLLISSYLTAIIKENGDKNTASMYLLIALFPVLILTLINSLTLLVTRIYDEYKYKDFIFILMTPILLLFYTVAFGQVYFLVNFVWVVNILLINILSFLINRDKNKEVKVD